MTEGESNSLPEDILLHSARTGNATMVQELLNDRNKGIRKLDINCKGKSKSNLGWTPLHLASYFGHRTVVELLLQHNANANVVNDNGDTPLHKAAYTGRDNVVLELIASNADVFIKNSEGQTPKQVSKEPTRKLLQAAEDGDIHRKEEKLFHAAREGDVNAIQKLLQGNNPVNIDAYDSNGNSALHCASYRRQKQVAIFLLQNGINTNSKNKRGQLALDLAPDLQMKQLLSVQSIRQLKKNATRFEGMLYKKVKVLGWRLTWGLLERGVLSFFNSRADASTGTKRKGYKYLDGAQVEVDQIEDGVFTVHYSNGSKQKFSIPLFNYQEVDRQKWVNSFAEHIEYSSYYLKQGLCLEESDEDSDEEKSKCVPLGTIKDVIQTTQAQQHVLVNQSTALKDIWNHCTKETANGRIIPNSIWDQFVSQAALVVETTHQLSSKLTHCVSLFSQQEEIRNIQLKQEQEMTRVLQESLHVLATENQELERSISIQHIPLSGAPSVYSTGEHDEFFDAFEGDDSDTPIANSPTGDDTKSTLTDSELFASFPPSMTASPTCSTLEDAETSPWSTRTRLPVTMFSRNNFSVWSILKQCIGKELSKITMPVVFNEPITLLQRMAENMEYAHLLDIANNSLDPLTRMEYVTAFAVSMTSSNWDRLGKPFNPILGETYELNHGNYKMICEQVSHHPPIGAFFVESPNYTLNGSLHPKLKFWGKSVEARPEGIITLHLLNHNEAYTWKYVTVCVHNIIVGKLWLEQYGTLEIQCHTNGFSTTLNFKPGGWFSKDLHKLEGFITKDGKKQKLVYGKWTDYLKCTDMESYDKHLKEYETFQPPNFPILPPEIPSTHNGHLAPRIQDETLINRGDKFMPGEDSLDIEDSIVLWHVTPRPFYSNQYYNFTLFAISLNELTDELKPLLPRTDSRLRPDCRKLEEGDIDGAAEEKNRLEEKQRDARKQRKKDKETWKPVWFSQSVNQFLNEPDWSYNNNNNYWLRDYPTSPDIF